MASDNKYYISLYLDLRRKMVSKKYPVKIRVFIPHKNQHRLYGTLFEYSESDFKKIWETERPKSDVRHEREILQRFLTEIEAKAEKIKDFSFDEFKDALFTKENDRSKVFYHYQKTIARLIENNRLGTADSYKCSLKSLSVFIKEVSKQDIEKLSFIEINDRWLMKYENFMLNTLKRSRTTIGIYLRPLRAIFNEAIFHKDISPDIYPFGKRRYKIPATKKVKKALTKEELRLLYDAEPANKEQEKAKDFWFFSYSCNGMNMKDICNLKYKNFKGENIKFFRAKTINTAKADLTEINVYLTDLSLAVIKKYGNKKKDPEEYIFPILSKTDTHLEQFRKTSLFTRFINQHIKLLAEKNNVTTEISTYWARHTFATNAIRKGASMEFVMEALNHHDLKTTQDYFAGFTNDDKKEFMRKMTDF